MALRLIVFAFASHFAGASVTDARRTCQSSDVGDASCDHEDTKHHTMHDEVFTSYIEQLFKKLNDMSASPDITTKMVAFGTTIPKLMDILKEKGIDILNIVGLADIKKEITKEMMKHPVCWWLVLCACHWWCRACQDDFTGTPSIAFCMEDACLSIKAAGILDYMTYACVMAFTVSLAGPSVFTFYFGAPSMLYILGFWLLFFQLPFFSWPFHVRWPQLLCLPLHPAYCLEFVANLASFLYLWGSLRKAEIMAWCCGMTVLLGVQLIFSFLESTPCLVLREFWGGDLKTMDYREFLHFFCCDRSIPWRVQRQFCAIFGKKISTREEAELQVIGLKELFKAIDANDDGRVSGAEFREFCDEHEGEYQSLIQHIQQAMRQKALSNVSGSGSGSGSGSDSARQSLNK